MLESPSGQLPPLTTTSVKVEGRVVTVTVPFGEIGEILVEFTVEGNGGRWVRRMLTPSEMKSYESNRLPFHFVSTPRQQRYQAIFQTPILDLSAATPITIREHWIVEGPKP